MCVSVRDYTADRFFLFSHTVFSSLFLSGPFSLGLSLNKACESYIFVIYSVGEFSSHIPI